MTGKITDILKLGNEYRITVTASECEFDSETIVKITKASKKRSMSANAYFHVLSDALADRVGVSKPYAKNFLLGRYGQRERSEDGNVVSIAVREDIDMMERSDIHTVLTGYTWVDDEEFAVYDVIRGTHTYTSAEMNYLIAGTIAECKEAGGIEVLPPREVARLEGIAEHYSK